MTLGQKLKELRSLKGLTQKELADQLHVSFQTVSKWENGENEPDIATLKELAGIFSCSVDYLISGEDIPKLVPDTEQKEKTVVIYQNEKHVCAKCGKDINEEDLVSEDVTKKERYGRTTRTVSVGQTYYHRDCLNEIKQQRAAEAAKIREENISKAKKRIYGWSIASGVATLGIALAIFLTNTKTIHPGLGVLYSFLIAYGIFSMIYCILSGSYIGDVFCWAAKLSIRFPGIIFSWSIEGFAWLIAMKILFAVLGFLIGVFALLLAIVLSASLGGISFPFVLVHNIRTEYTDSLVY